MRQGQPNNNNKRMRGRNRKGPNPLTRSFESNGPDVKIRGTALHVAEKYLQLARDASSSGDRVAGESYLQHAEHYFRIVAAAQAQMPQAQQGFNNNDDEDGDEDDDRANGYGDGERLPHQQVAQPGFGPPDQQPQPYLNGNGQGGQGGDGGGQVPEVNRYEGNRDNRGGGDNRDNRDNRDHGGFRGRRRRPYRGGGGERFGSDQGEQRSADNNFPANPAPPPNVGPSED